MPTFKIFFLGTASAIPTNDRGLSCTAIQYENELEIFDCGEGAQRAALEMGLPLSKECSIFITHMHGDHVVGLLGLLQTMSMHRRERPLRVFGPKLVIPFIALNQKMLNFGLTYEVIAKAVRRGTVYDSKTSGFRVLAERSEHSTLSYSYIFEQKERPGRFNTKEALRLGVPEGPLWSKLQKGAPVKSPITGRMVRPGQVLGPPRAGVRVGISGDTRPSSKLEAFFKGCEVIIFDSTYSDAHETNARENMHTTAREAATLAKNAGAKQLILTHFSSRYRTVGVLVKQAREVFPNTIAAQDRMIYDVAASFPSKP
ncbi:MAG TPA: ribonuclease Z [Nitrososphaerales archaeon]|nr:ribonuclease Z [Nitrososphaerales archaeon]